MFPALVALMQWGDSLGADDGTGVELLHVDCGAPLRAVVECADGHGVQLEEAAVRLRAERA